MHWAFSLQGQEYMQVERDAMLARGFIPALAGDTKWFAEATVSSTLHRLRRG